MQKKSVTNAKKKFSEEFNENKNYCMVQDHCHYKGKYNDVTHSICNLGHRCQKKFLCCSIIVLIMISISQSKCWSKIQRPVYWPSRKKHGEVYNILCTNQ